MTNDLARTHRYRPRTFGIVKLGSDERLHPRDLARTNVWELVSARDVASDVGEVSLITLRLYIARAPRSRYLLFWLSFFFKNSR
jgi:hypothetical protein